MADRRNVQQHTTIAGEHAPALRRIACRLGINRRRAGALVLGRHLPAAELAGATF
jgi:hypothetical protein